MKISNSIICVLLLAVFSCLHVTQVHAQQEQQHVVVVVQEDNFSNIANHENKNEMHNNYIRGSIMTTQEFEREMQVCIGRGNRCARTSDCCQPLSCRQNTCQSSTPCYNPGSFCNRDTDCCQGRCTGGQCGGGVSTCGVLGSICVVRADCCSGYDCFGSRCEYSRNPGQCRDIWDTCTATSQCCSNLHCRQNTCGRAGCGVNGQSCRQSVDCCAGNTCRNGVCNGTGTGSTTNCKPLDNSCFADIDCCGDTICSGGRCSRRGGVNGCSSTVGALCRTSTDCCGPNMFCDRLGGYCRY